MNFDDGGREEEGGGCERREPSRNDVKTERKEETNSLSRQRANFFAFIERFHER